MKLKIISGELEVEIIDDSLSDIRKKLLKLSQEEIEELTMRKIISNAGKVSPHSSKSNQQNKLNAKPKMPI